jgi:hypothetical protein
MRTTFFLGALADHKFMNEYTALHTYKDQFVNVI